MTIFQLFGLLSATIVLIGQVPYFISIINGKTKPQKAALSIFAVLSIISFSGQLSEGASASLWFAATLMICQIGLFIVSLRYGTNKITKFDILCLFAAIIVLLIWYATQSAATALVLLVLVNTIGKFLIIQKVYKSPQSELLFSWVAFTVASAFAALSVGSLNWVLLLVPVQNGISVGLIALMIVIRRSQLSDIKSMP